MSSSLRPHGLQHARLPCSSLSPWVCSNSCPFSHWCHPNIILFHSHLLSLSQHQGLFQWISSSHKVAEILDLQLQHQSFQWIFRVDFFQDWLVWSPCSPRGFSSSTIQKQQLFSAQSSFFLMDHLSCLYITTGKDIVLTRQTLVKVMPLLFNTLSRFLIAFLPRCKHLLILLLQSPSAVILETKKIKCLFFVIYLPWSDETRCSDLSFLNADF